MDYRGFRKKGAIGNSLKYEPLTRPKIYKRNVVIDEAIIEKYKIAPAQKILMRIKYLRDIANVGVTLKQNSRYARWLSLPETVKHLGYMRRYRDKRNSYAILRRKQEKARKWRQLIQSISL